jgi:hypothetical protein
MKLSTLARRTARITAALAILLPAAAAQAQDTTLTTTAAPAARRLEVRFTSGRLAAAGAPRNVIQDAPLSALQLSWRVTPGLAVTGTLGWARSHDLAATNAPKLDVFTGDLGLEARTAERRAIGELSTSTFVAAGAGARSYDSRSAGTPTTHNLAGYLGAGGELGFKRFALRIEARDYLSGFHAIGNGPSAAARNDVVIMAAFRINHRPLGAR